MSVFAMWNNWTERVTNGVKIIDSDHAYIHEGIAFSVTDTKDVTNAGHIYQLKTPAEKYVHYRPANVSIDGNSLVVKLTEGSTIPMTALTTLYLTAYDHNRLHANTAEVLMHSSASVLSGTVIDQTYIFGGVGQGQTKAGASAGEPLEWVLKRDTTYQFSIASLTTALIKVGIKLFWYEEASA